MHAVLGICLIIVISSGSSAFAFCIKPSAPYCATSFGDFTDQWEFDRCKREMESYQDDVQRYLNCRNDEAQTAVEEAREDNNRALNEYNDAVESFNNRAR
jgi:hypothetical protein